MAGDKVSKIYMNSMCPHTHNSLQKLVMAAEKCTKSAGKKTIFGKDKSYESKVKFLSVLGLTIHAMMKDELIQSSSSTEIIIEELVAVIDRFSMAYPNWPLAYEFVFYYLHEYKSTAVKEINILLYRPIASTKKPAPQTSNNEDVVKQNVRELPDGFKYKGKDEGESRNGSSHNQGMSEGQKIYGWIMLISWIFLIIWVFFD